ncbi:MAG TPA: tRNA guanosine(34) transglycosylase Tgt [Thermodesulfobacteriota bacterium]|nr:tRNA guanosine(34) transglycosylase Tgt [Thermodesulfobacteriota bacterium]
MFKFEVLKRDKDTNARLGRVHTAHGTVETPAFMPVATQGSVKAMTPEEIESLGFKMIVVNAYHMYLRPGHERVEKLGGLHKLMGWDYPILTDSGGFQVLSLSKVRKIEREGIRFRSHLDGGEHLLTPEKCMEIQDALDTDIMMCLDECPPFPSTYEYMRGSVELTTRWARLCKQTKPDSSRALFGIVQGGVFPDLRKKSAEELLEIGFDGYAVGGLGIGEPKEKTYEIGELAVPHLPFGKPRYTMGLGMPEDIVQAVSMGVDLFDCVLPTRNARNGTLFTKRGKMVIKNAQYGDDESPVDEDCGCYTCRTFSRAYLRHLYQAGEILASRLLTLHNLYYYGSLMKQIREAIGRGEFHDFRGRFQSERLTEN